MDQVPSTWSTAGSYGHSVECDGSSNTQIQAVDIGGLLDKDGLAEVGILGRQSCRLVSKDERKGFAPLDVFKRFGRVEHEGVAGVLGKTRNVFLYRREDFGAHR